MVIVWFFKFSLQFPQLSLYFFIAAYKYLWFLFCSYAPLLSTYLDVFRLYLINFSITSQVHPREVLQSWEENLNPVSKEIPRKSWHLMLNKFSRSFWNSWMWIRLSFGFSRTPFWLYLWIPCWFHNKVHLLLSYSQTACPIIIKNVRNEGTR